MTYTIKGKVLNILPPQHGVSKFGKNWEKQDILLTTIKFDSNTGQEIDNLRNILKFSFFGERMALLEGLQPGEKVTVTFDIQGKVIESNGRQNHMTELLPLKIERENAVPISPVPTNCQGSQQRGIPNYPAYPGDTLGYQR